MLTIKNLKHTYPNGVQALNDVTLNIPKGIFGLLGPNGAGKSSLMRTLATLQQPLSGTLKFGQIDVLKNPELLRRTLGYLPQDFGVYPQGSAYKLLDHLALLKGLTNRTARRRVVEGLLVQTNLYDVRHKRLATFSGGMRQRFGIAQALIGNPSLIIVDEPTAGLDPQERNRFYNLLSEIGEDSVVILSTHIVEDVADLCPNLAILVSGRIIQQGTPDKLTRALGGCIWKKTIEKNRLSEFQEAHQVVSIKFVAGKLAIRIKSESHPGDNFEPASPSLEDVYFCAISEILDNPSKNTELA